MTKNNSNLSRNKDPVAIKIGKRIAQARKMAGYKTAKAFRERLPNWPENRLSWYEAGYSMPHPSDVEVIAKETGSSVCWIMFGLGPIRSGERDLQAVRYQNLVFLFREAEGSVGDAEMGFAEKTGLDREQLVAFVDNPVIVESLQQITLIQIHGRPDALDRCMKDQTPKLVNVKPMFLTQVELNGLDIA